MKTYVVLASTEDYVRKREDAKALAEQGIRCVVFRDEALMKRWISSLGCQELQQRQRDTLLRV
jgi:hypothetical protein